MIGAGAHYQAIHVGLQSLFRTDVRHFEKAVVNGFKAPMPASTFMIARLRLQEYLEATGSELRLEIRSFLNPLDRDGGRSDRKRTARTKLPC